MKPGGDEGDLEKTLADLIDYTDYHFKREEALMEACDYPNLAHHKKAHEAIIAQVGEFYLKSSGKPIESMAGELAECLEAWLQNHIMGMDKDYQGWIAGNGEIIDKVAREAEEKIGVGKIAVTYAAGDEPPADALATG